MSQRKGYLPILILLAVVLGLFLLIAPVVLLMRHLEPNSMRNAVTHGITADDGGSKVHIPSDANAYTMRSLHEDELRYFLRTNVAAYKKVGRHNSAWDAAAVRFLEQNSQLSARMSGAPTLEKLLSGGQQLMKVGCTDPMVIYYHGLNYFKAGQPKASIPYLKRAFEGFKHSQYSRGRARFAPTRLEEIYATLPVHTFAQYNEVYRQPPYKTLALQWISDSLRDGSFTDHEQPIFFDLLAGEQNKLFTTQELVEKLERTPGADPYIVAIFRGELEIYMAWQIRGGGLAVEVRKEDWKGFTEHMEKARNALTAAWKNHPEYPQAPSLMIEVAMAGYAAPGETIYTWFDRTVAAQCDYQPAYDKLLWALYPRWHGSHDAMYSFGVTCLDTKRFDTDIPLQFFNALRAVTDDGKGDMTFWDKPETYQHLKEMCEGYLLEVPPDRRNRYQTLYAGCLLNCKHFDEAKSMFDALGPRADANVLKTFWFISPAYARLLARQHLRPVFHR